MYLDSEEVKKFYGQTDEATAKVLRQLIRKSKNFNATSYNSVMANVEITATIPKEFVGKFFDINSDFLNELTEEVI